MAAAPNSSSWAVTCGNSANSWASGALVVNSSGSGTYKGQSVTWDSSTTIGWSVTVPHGGQNCTLVFSGGVINTAVNPHTLSGDGPTVTCSGEPVGGNDTWSASETSREPVKPAYKG